MKRTLFALTLMAGCLLPLAPRAQAATEVTLNLFYDNLSPYGSWIEAGDYGYCFQPNVAAGHADWRPYTDGYWAYTDAGWTWVSYEDFGWATYHYGRWANLDGYGWVWVPGYEWGPAWVSWRTGGDYIGWAPLPAQPRGVVYERQPITAAVDVTFGIGPLYYNFVDIRYIGEPVLRGHIVEPRRNVTIINRTVNVTNITYNNTTVINNGPDVNRLNRYSARPIQHLKLERETNANFGGRRGNLNRVNGDALVVAAPPVQRSEQKIAPRQVKAKVQKPKVEKGWQGVDNRQQVETEMKKENAKNVPPPSFQPQQGRKAEAKAGQNAAGAPTNEANKAANQQQATGQSNARRQEAGQPGRAQDNAHNDAGKRAGAPAEQRKAQPQEKAQQEETGQAGQNAAEQKRAAREAGQQRAQERQQKAKEQQPGRAVKHDEQRRADQTQPNNQEKAERAQQRPEQRAQQQENKKADREEATSPEPPKNDNARERRRAQRPDRGDGAEKAQQTRETPKAERSRRAAGSGQAEQSHRAAPAAQAQAQDRTDRHAQQAQGNERQNARQKPKRKGANEEKPDQPEQP